MILVEHIHAKLTMLEYFDINDSRVHFCTALSKISRSTMTIANRPINDFRVPVCAAQSEICRSTMIIANMMLIITDTPNMHNHIEVERGTYPDLGLWRSLLTNRLAGLRSRFEAKVNGRMSVRIPGQGKRADYVMLLFGQHLPRPTLSSLWPK